MAKDLLDHNIDGHVIYFCGETANIAKPDAKIHRPVVDNSVIKNRIVRMRLLVLLLLSCLLLIR